MTGHIGEAGTKQTGVLWSVKVRPDCPQLEQHESVVGRTLDDGDETESFAQSVH